MTALAAGSVSDKICRYASSIMAPASPFGTPEPARNNGHKQVSLIIIKSHQGSGGKTKHGLPPVNGNAEERFTG
ncbi:hypothetical protein [Enterobacter kobei]|uniref:hypothetical protein n=1 Tax=Enterobacter kobei TaxID=208224 RepID=UPI00388F8AF3